MVSGHLEVGAGSPEGHSSSLERPPSGGTVSRATSGAAPPASVDFPATVWLADPRPAPQALRPRGRPPLVLPRALALPPVSGPRLVGTGKVTACAAL